MKIIIDMQKPKDQRVEIVGKDGTSVFTHFFELRLYEKNGKKYSEHTFKNFTGRKPKDGE